MRVWFSIAATLTLAGIASAQMTMVIPRPGVPLTVESVEERVTKNRDGTSTMERRASRVYRDAAGRMRIERELPQPFGAPLLMIQLADPVEGFMAILETPAKIAHRAKSPKAGGFGVVIGGGRGLVDVPGKKTRKTEDLGKQTIDGVEFEGSRTTTTSDDQPSLVAVEERWMSKELSLIGLIKYSGPDGENTARIRHIDREAPDPKMFAIPDDYRIREMTP